ncbi:MAG TPA: DUF1707 domain-containing protein [Nocardioides sp.]|nr:DUF1707 domain-containing protein [Nocardioides sp.]
MSRAQLRIGDAEREQAAAELAEHYAVGRLDRDEHAERLDRVWAARTHAELDPVFADLPGHRTLGSTTQGAPRPVARRRPRVPAPLWVLVVVLGAVAVVTHLPLILIGLGVWFFFLRGGCRPHGWAHPQRR